MKDKIISNAHEDIKLYNEDFNCFFGETEIHYINNKEELYLCYKSTLLFKNWKTGLNSINNDLLDNIFNEIQQDINLSFHLSAYGLYRTANMHLRSSIELSLQLIYFFDHYVEYQLWKSGKFVIKHEKLTTYIKTHPKFKKEEIEDIDSIVNKITGRWKSFSKHIHAESLSFFHTEKLSSKSNHFEIGDFNMWKSGFLRTTNLLNSLFLCFFKDELGMFPSNIKKMLEK